MTETKTIDGATFVLDYRSEDHAVEKWDRDGIDWFHAPKPRRWHRCRIQTQGWVNHFTLVDRCACGAIRMDGHGPWMEKNS